MQGATPQSASLPPAAAAGAPSLADAAIHEVLPPARRARRIAFGLSIVAVAFSLACGYAGRHAFALRDAAPEVGLPWLAGFLVLLLIVLLIRFAAAVCEVLWLERSWSNMPEHLRSVGPVKEVSSGLAIAITFVPGVSWVWKLGLVVGIANGFEAIRSHTPFTAAIPRRLGMAAVIVGWVPGLNVYIAPFLWELFATRIDVCIQQILDARSQVLRDAI